MSCCLWWICKCKQYGDLRLWNDRINDKYQKSRFFVETLRSNRTSESDVASGGTSSGGQWVRHTLNSRFRPPCSTAVGKSVCRQTAASVIQHLLTLWDWANPNDPVSIIILGHFVFFCYNHIIKYWPFSIKFDRFRTCTCCLSDVIPYGAHWQAVKVRNPSMSN
jgi:hypothetical protein